MITFKLISSVWDVLTVRLIRNACRRFMTQDTNKINIIQQLQWWRDYTKSEDKWCYLMYVHNIPAGYGLVRKTGDKYWLSGGLIPDVRGKGLGRKLFKFLVNEFAFEGKPIFLEVRKSNEIAFELYQKLGFQKISEENGIVVMQWKRKK